MRRHFTLGESSSYNYLVHVDHAGPTWYMQDVGHGAGKFLHSPRKIFAAPPTYEFSIGQTVTHPLRLDPSYWTEGARPRFHVKDQFWSTIQNINLYSRILANTGRFDPRVSIFVFGGRAQEGCAARNPEAMAFVAARNVCPRDVCPDPRGEPLYRRFLRLLLENIQNQHRIRVGTVN